jgi:hypothetical protein
MNSKRVFAHNNNMNFNDYHKNKNGIEMIKNIRSKPNPLNLSYDRFILIAKTYFKYRNNIHIGIPVNLYNSNTSFIVYETTLSHMKDCNNCKYSKDILKLYDCKELNQILYPYGKYLEDNISNPIFLHSRVNIDDWCACKKEIPKLNNLTNHNKIIPNHYNSYKKINEKTCNTCSNVQKKKKINSYETNTSMYPSQNNFIFQNIDQDNNYEQIQRMNAYSIYPNIKDCINNVNTINKSCTTGLCKETRPLFI